MSEPIKSDTGKVLGTFAMYFTEPRSPSTTEIEIIEACVRSVKATYSDYLLLKNRFIVSQHEITVLIYFSSQYIRNNTIVAKYTV